MIIKDILDSLQLVRLENKKTIVLNCWIFQSETRLPTPLTKKMNIALIFLGGIK